MKRSAIRRMPPKLKRKPLRRVGKRAARERDELVAFRAAGNRCERCNQRNGMRHADGSRVNLQAHHRLPRSRGGSHEPSNGAALCTPCHRSVHDHTANDWGAWLKSGKRAARVA